MEESRSEIGGSIAQDEQVSKLKELVAPAKGLEKDEKGQLKVDKEKIEEKKELEIEEGKKIDVSKAIKQPAPIKAALS